MSKKRFVKFLAMALVLVMLASVTAFGATDDIAFTVNGYTALGSLYASNTSASADTYYDTPGSLYVSVTFNYYVTDSPGLKSSGNSLDNTGIHVYVTAYGYGADVTGVTAQGFHQVNGIGKSTFINL